MSAVAGVAGNPAVYYMGTPGGGVWQTTDGGMIWTPISDSVPVASIGALGVAPSNPSIVYFGTGDVTEVGGSVNAGHGVYKSADAGHTWTHVGLDDTWHIGALWVHPRNPDEVVVAALGHTFTRGPERGIFRTTDGGRSWTKTLYVDDETGAVDVVFDVNEPRIGFATTWKHFVGAGGAASLLGGGGSGALYKTTDGGATWTPIRDGGLPTERLGRIGVAVTMSGRRVFAIVAAPRGGLFRSDDGGSTWRLTTDDPRIDGNSYFGKVYVDPKNPDVVYVMQTSMYRSLDGGATFIALKGAPGGDDNHVLWIDPTNASWMIMGSDQGAVVSLDAGRTWSSWFNQPTGQLYHVSTDDRWPYWVYGMQQDSGAIGTLSRGDYGAITMLDWDTVAGYEFGYIVPDPLNPNIVYAGGEGRGVWRLDRTNRQVRTVSPNISRDGKFRTTLHPPLAFSPHDQHALYEGTQFVLVTRDGGASWQTISPDLTLRSGTASDGRAAISALAISPIRDGIIWTGSTNGVVRVTEDGGKSWRDASPTPLTSSTFVGAVEPSHFDAATAYVGAEAHTTNDFRPHIFRTRDFGRSWQEIASGIPDDSFVRVVREDPGRRGLLYAGTESGMFVSFDDGEQWQTLQLNLPTVSVRDMVVHDDDLVIATYGRAMWILDDVTPLRQIDRKTADSDVVLFKPRHAIRVRRSDNNNTPIPPDMPAADNPPAGAIIDYYLRQPAAGDLTIAIYDNRNRLVRELSSVAEAVDDEPPPEIPTYWLAPPQILSKDAGLTRAVWDLRFPPPPALSRDYPVAAIAGRTLPDPQGPLAAPGAYEVRLSVGGRTYRQPLTVVSDPRVHVTPADFQAQLELSQQIVGAMTSAFDDHQRAAGLRKEVSDRIRSLSQDADQTSVVDALRDFDRKAARIGGAPVRGAGGAPLVRLEPTFASVNGTLASLLTIVDGADGAPTEPMRAAFGDYCRDLTDAGARWDDLVSKDLPAINTRLSSVGALPITVSPREGGGAACGK